MICEIICVAGFLCMSNLDIVHISSAYVHVICILSEHMRIMCILSAVVLDIFLPNRQCQCDLYVISSTLYRSLHVVHTYTHYLLCIFHIPHIAYYLQLSFPIFSPYTHAGWPQHRENRENREFGSYFFQTGKTQGILL